MLSIISPELQMQHKNIDAHTMNMHIKELFDASSKTKRYEISKKIFHCKMTNDFSMNIYVLKMIDYIGN